MSSTHRAVVDFSCFTGAIFQITMMPSSLPISAASLTSYFHRSQATGLFWKIEENKEAKKEEIERMKLKTTGWSVCKEERNSELKSQL
jgi:hypothetical protein